MPLSIKALIQVTLTQTLKRKTQRNWLALSHGCQVGKIEKMERCQNQLSKQHGISVHFSSQHENYYGAWSYVTKEDTDFIQSKNHPVLT